MERSYFVACVPAEQPFRLEATGQEPILNTAKRRFIAVTSCCRGGTTQRVDARHLPQDPTRAAFRLPAEVHRPPQPPRRFQTLLELSTHHDYEEIARRAT